MRPVKRGRKNKERERVLLEHDPIEQRSLLTPMRQFDYTPDAETTEALSFLASWYNSDHYANLEHERGRDSNVSGRHMLQTPYGRSGMGKRDEPYQRALRIAYSPRLDTKAELPPYTYGLYDAREETVKTDRDAADPASALVHELSHAAEGVLPVFVRDQQEKNMLGLVGVDRRFIDTTQLSGYFASENHLDPFQSSNPYTVQEWRDRMFGDEWTTKDQRYVNEPAEVSARLRQVAFEAQQKGLLPRGDFRLTDDILKQLESQPSGSAWQLLNYLTPEQRSKLYQEL